MDFKKYCNLINVELDIIRIIDEIVSMVKVVIRTMLKKKSKTGKNNQHVSI